MSKENDSPKEPQPSPDVETGKGPAETRRPAAGVSRSGNVSELPPANRAGATEPPPAIIEQAPEATPDEYEPKVSAVAEAGEGNAIEPAGLGMVRIERTAGYTIEGLPVIVRGKFVQIPLAATREVPGDEPDQPRTVPVRIFDMDPITARFALEAKAPDGSPAFIERAGEGPTRTKTAEPAAPAAK